MKLFAAFLLAILLSGSGVTWFSYRTSRRNLPLLILNKYEPSHSSHVVFLGSSLTDASIDCDLFESHSDAINRPVECFNLALAEMSNTAFHYLIVKNWILKRNTPAAIIIEIRTFPFLNSFDAFAPGNIDQSGTSAIFDLLDFATFCQLNGGIPSPGATIDYFLHKHWPLYHDRATFQRQVTERLSLIGVRATDERYVMHKDAFEIMSSRAREERAAASRSMPTPKFFHSANNYLHALSQLSDKHHFKLILLKPPFPPADTILGQDSIYSQYDGTLREACHEMGITVLDFSTAPQGENWTYTDRIHLDRSSSERFTYMAADSIMQVLSGRRLN